jgi:hypothetical protein
MQWNHNGANRRFFSSLRITCGGSYYDTHFANGTMTEDLDIAPPSVWMMRDSNNGRLVCGCEQRQMRGVTDCRAVSMSAVESHCPRSPGTGHPDGDTWMGGTDARHLSLRRLRSTSHSEVMNPLFSNLAVNPPGPKAFLWIDTGLASNPTAIRFVGSIPCQRITLLHKLIEQIAYRRARFQKGFVVPGSARPPLHS